MIEPRKDRAVRGELASSVRPVIVRPPAECKCGAKLSRYRLPGEQLCAPCQKAAL